MTSKKLENDAVETAWITTSQVTAGFFGLSLGSSKTKMNEEKPKNKILLEFERLPLLNPAIP